MHTEGTLIALIQHNQSLDARAIPRDRPKESRLDQSVGGVHTRVHILLSIVIVSLADLGRLF